jgi:hypothetical protein
MRLQDDARRKRPPRTYRVNDIAQRHQCSVRHVNMTISMAFIAPGLVKAAVEGRLPRGIGIANLRHAPLEWSRQYERLGLPLAYLLSSGNSAATELESTDI